MNSFLSTEDDLEDLTGRLDSRVVIEFNDLSIFQYICAFSDIWLRILLWAFITTALVYSTAGIYSAVTWRRTKPMVFACPLLYLLFGAVKFVIVDLITCMYHCKSCATVYHNTTSVVLVEGIFMIRPLYFQWCPLWAIG